MNSSEILNDLKKGKYAPVYFLQGEETFFIDQVSDYIEKNAIDEASKSFNQTVLYGKDVNVVTILNNARRFPMMSERQLVLVKEAQSISDLKLDSGQEQLIQYLNKPVGSTILVFCHKNKSLDKRKSLYKAIQKHAVVLDAKKMYDNQVPAWIENYVKQKGYRINAKATHILSDSIGNNLERLSNEIDKMLINFPEPVEINEDMVQKYVGISKDFNVFELQKALTTKDIMKANKIINYFAANPKSNPLLPVIAVLFSFYSKLLIAYASPDKSERAIASALKVNPFFVKDYMFAMRNYSPAQVMNNISHLRKADLQLKGYYGSGLREGDILKELIFQLLH
ncbi:MAG: DNA polymerase III subunit delta [Candidatus Cyclobacteriaceae bacterium M2_1C_046]